MENQLNNVSSEPKYVYVVISEEFLIEVFNSEDDAKKYENMILNEYKHVDTCYIIKKMINYKYIIDFYL
jgi:hypothetical protein